MEQKIISKSKADRIIEITQKSVNEFTDNCNVMLKSVLKTSLLHNYDKSLFVSYNPDTYKFRVTSDNNTTSLDDIDVSEIEPCEIYKAIEYSHKQLSIPQDVDRIMDICLEKLDYDNQFINDICKARQSIVSNFIKKHIFDAHVYLNDNIRRQIIKAYMEALIMYHTERNTHKYVTYNPIEQSFKITNDAHGYDGWFSVYKVKSQLVEECFPNDEINVECDEYNLPQANKEQLFDLVSKMVSSMKIEYEVNFYDQTAYEDDLYYGTDDVTSYDINYVIKSTIEEELESLYDY